ncbi:MAG: antitoxin PHD [Firmicutes bacterium HGW-Firmicutes-7]|nr:MAG: antitoxin PHD [Firmicutes bacterium HGW-Firmicutes-7]
MPTIRPSSDLRNNYNEISTFCHESSEPVYITKNGKGDLAVLSIETFERLVGKFELRKLLEEGMEDIKNKRTLPIDEAFNKLRKGITQ